MGAARLHDGNAVVGGPLEELAQVVAIGLERPVAVAGKERHGNKLRLIDLELGVDAPIVVAADSMVVMGWSFLWSDDQPTRGREPTFGGTRPG